MPSQPTPELSVPSFPGYEVGELIGEGGMGLVFRAFDRSLNRPTALKVLHRTGPSDLARFLAEAEATAAVDHPNVVRVYAYGEVGGRAYLATELCGGGTLADRLRAGPVAPREAAALVVQVSRGVAAVHALGIVHRDLKPSNVLFDGGGVPKVADFGVAKRASSDLTRTDALMGTPAYMAPEQARGHAKSAGPAADVWALGVILYECLTGVRPFDDPDSWLARQKVLHNRPTPPHCLIPSLPRDLEQICLRCLAKSPGGRYPTARELADDLDRFLAGEPVWARRVLVARSVSLLSRRKPVLMASGVLLALTIGLATGMVPWWRDKQTEPTPPVKDATPKPSDTDPLPDPPVLFVPYDISFAVKEIESLLSKSDFLKANEKIEELARHDEGETKRLRAKLVEYQLRVANQDAEIELNATIKLLDSLGQREEARKRLPKLRKLNPALADQWEERWRVRAIAPADDRLQRARGSFARRRLPEGLAILEDVLRTPMDQTTRQTAEALKTVWGLTRAASVLPVTDATQLAAYQKSMPDPASHGGLSAEDRTALTSFRRIDLALRIAVLPQSVDVQESPRILTEAGRELFRNRRAWADAEGLPGGPAAVAAGLFDRAATMTKKPDDYAWAGICRSEVPGTPFLKLSGDLNAARDSGSGPATLVLAGLVAAREPWRDPGTWPDKTTEVAALRRADEQFRKAIAACKADKATDRTDELLLLFDRAAAVTARLADVETDPKKKAALWAALDALAKDFQTALPGRLEGLRYAARALEGQAPAQSDQRFTPTGAYARADQLYAWSGGLFGAPPDVLVSRGRNLLKWTEDKFRAGGGTYLDLERLNRADALLREVTARGRTDVQPATLAEAHYWLGRAAMLSYEAASSSGDRSSLYRNAMTAYTAAVTAASKLDEDPWTEQVLRAVYEAAVAQMARQSDRRLNPIDSETTAQSLDEFADRKGPRAPTPVWRAALKVRAIRLREAARPKAEDWFARIRKVAEPLPESFRDREADLRFGLLMTQADGYGAREKNSTHHDHSKAVKYAKDAVALAKGSKALSDGQRAEAHGALGVLQFQGGTTENKYETWPDARTNLEAALRLLADERSASGAASSEHPDEWKWRYALGGILAQTSVDEKDTAKSADMGARACWLQMPRYIAVFNLSQKAPDPDDKALAERFFRSSKAWFTIARDSCLIGVKKFAEDPRSPAWGLASAELTYVISNAEQRKTEVKNLAAAVDVASARLKELPPEMKAEVEAQIARTKTYLPRE